MNLPYSWHVVKHTDTHDPMAYEVKDTNNNVICWVPAAPITTLHAETLAKTIACVPDMVDLIRSLEEAGRMIGPGKMTATLHHFYQEAKRIKNKLTS